MKRPLVPVADAPQKEYAIRETLLDDVIDELDCCPPANRRHEQRLIRLLQKLREIRGPVEQDQP